MYVFIGMNKIRFCLFLFPLFFTSCHAQNAKSNSTDQVAVVELFTSEGCSSCPPADRLLSRYADIGSYEGVPILALAYHVDYWDYLGWRDSFSSSAFSDRQRMYAESMNLNGVYTPQIVINGTTQLVGSDEGSLREGIQHMKADSRQLSFTDLKLSNDDKTKKVKYTIQGDVKDCEINIAIVTPSVSVNIRRGENRGKLLTHTNVVKKLLTTEALQEGNINLKATDMRDSYLVVFIQDKKNKEILTARKLE
jgi:hypothetical protein